MAYSTHDAPSDVTSPVALALRLPLPNPLPTRRSLPHICTYDGGRVIVKHCVSILGLAIVTPVVGGDDSPIFQLTHIRVPRAASTSILGWLCTQLSPWVVVVSHGLFLSRVHTELSPALNTPLPSLSYHTRAQVRALALVRELLLIPKFAVKVAPSRTLDTEPKLVVNRGDNCPAGQPVI